MDEFWKKALKCCPGLAISGVVAVTIFPRIFESKYLDGLNESQVYGLFVSIAVLTFLLCTFIVFKWDAGERSLGGNKISINKSSVRGDVVGGNSNGRREKK
ncbi:hypothetical protein [Halomonas dongshanensis]|uniref:Uncharacterized protein n=1 Tax=Halomonas dongshanensis TaxID=2890835 RepID=A0ABT2EC73_9GAMM|nr:hypothetical protein [Halomonas dongshanensis]MCS2609171.1 hypothetical protein [Halomonas dongshanensis]